MKNIFLILIFMGIGITSASTQDALSYLFADSIENSKIRDLLNIEVGEDKSYLFLDTFDSSIKNNYIYQRLDDNLSYELLKIPIINREFYVNSDFEDRKDTLSVANLYYLGKIDLVHNQNFESFLVLSEIKRVDYSSYTLYSIFKSEATKHISILMLFDKINDRPSQLVKCYIADKYSNYIVLNYTVAIDWLEGGHTIHTSTAKLKVDKYGNVKEINK